MICLESLKSSEFAIFLTNRGQKSVTMFISSCFNNYQLNFKISEKKVTPQWDSNPQPLGSEATEHLHNRMRQKTAEK